MQNTFSYTFGIKPKEYIANEQGIIHSPQFGTYALSLPGFADFVHEYYIG